MLKRASGFVVVLAMIGFGRLSIDDEGRRPVKPLVMPT